MEKNLKSLLMEISANAFIDEKSRVEHLVTYLSEARKSYEAIEIRSENYIKTFRNKRLDLGVEAFFHQYGLDSKEGVALMSLAEALLRIPDSDTANDLIHDKLKGIDWEIDDSDNLPAVLKASNLGIKLAQKIFSFGKTISSVVDPIVRESIKQAMTILGDNFVMGETIESAIKRGKSFEEKGYMISYDMLGEGARSERQAHQYFLQYIEAIENIKEGLQKGRSMFENPGISIKLSALYSHYDLINYVSVREKLIPRLKDIIEHAMSAGIFVTIDAEESARLDISMEVFTEILMEKKFKNFDGIGLAIQAYHKNAVNVIDYIIELATQLKKRIPVRLVKGAYWDSEIKKAQVGGLPGYTVFTEKSYTDLSYLVCAHKLLQSGGAIYPQFATHNAVTIAEIEEMANGRPIEFQLLHGMGRGIYDQVVGRYPCRIYAPVGEHKSLLPYLIRRLLENSANTSFVKKIVDKEEPLALLVKDPIKKALEKGCLPNPTISLPENIYGKRDNSKGLDLGNKAHLENMITHLKEFENQRWNVAPLVKGREKKRSTSISSVAPYDFKKEVGKVKEASNVDVKDAIEATSEAFDGWSKTPVDKRADILDSMANLLEKNKYELISLCMREAGKTLQDSISEIREAIDFCHYYAHLARQMIGEDFYMRGPTGESNKLSLHGRGVFLCISPWNFPLAIFIGQVAAALVTGNTVIAKPAEQTPAIAAMTVKLLIRAGLPSRVIALLPGNGEYIGKYLLEDHNIAGVVFTGSVETAKKINRTISSRGGIIIPFIAETGGQNAMIIDSTALIEQTVDDIVLSAFGSAGQRCSALRVLYVQDEIADDLIELLSGAMSELRIGSPEKFNTNIGPVIDKNARNKLDMHIKQTKLHSKLLYSCSIEKEEIDNGYFIAPHVFEIKSIKELPGEVFGPILHLIRYRHDQLDNIIKEINECGYGLTLGIQSRISSRAEYIANNVRVGNIYVNRSMIGATVGVQPFGGEGLSGTGPKAGGPHYLLRFVTERTYTVNTAAIGGNNELLR